MIEKLRDKDYVLSHLETRIMPRQAVMNSPHNYVYINVSNQNTIFDWLITFAVRLSDDSCAVVTTDLVSHEMPWLTCPGDLWDYWMESEHDDFICEPVHQLLGLESANPSPLYVISTASHEGGGGVFLHPSMQKRLHELFPDGYFLILSSKHEALACERGVVPAENVAEIFHEISHMDDVTPMADRVTEDVYYCDKPFHMGKVVIP